MNKSQYINNSPSPTGSLQMDVDTSFPLGWANTAGVVPRVRTSDIPDPEGDVPRHHSVRKKLSSPFEVWILFSKMGDSIAVLVNNSFFTRLCPRDWQIF